MVLPSSGYSFLRTLTMALCLALALGACSPRQMIIDGVAHELASQGSAPETDLELAREASAFYLKLSESMLRASPDNRPLAEAVTAGFAQYAFAFVAFEAEQLEMRDAKRAQVLRQRAARLYARAQRHGAAALERRSPGLLKALSERDPADGPRLPADEVGLAYWTVAAWGSWIALSKHDPEIVAQLPQALLLARLAWQADPRWGQGALASLMGSLELARPGGSRAEALRYFDQAIALAGEQAAGPWVAKAEAIALPAGDQESFRQLLQRAVTIAARTPNLQNEAILARARWLLANVDELF